LFQVRHVAPDEGHAGSGRLRFRDQIEADNLSALLSQMFHNLPANIAAAANDQNFHKTPLWISARSILRSASPTQQPRGCTVCRADAFVIGTAPELNPRLRWQPSEKIDASLVPE